MNIPEYLNLKCDLGSLFIRGIILRIISQLWLAICGVARSVVGVLFFKHSGLCAYDCLSTQRLKSVW